MSRKRSRSFSPSWSAQRDRGAPSPLYATAAWDVFGIAHDSRLCETMMVYAAPVDAPVLSIQAPPDINAGDPYPARRRVAWMLAADSSRRPCTVYWRIRASSEGVAAAALKAALESTCRGPCSTSTSYMLSHGRNVRAFETSLHPNWSKVRRSERVSYVATNIRTHLHAARDAAKRAVAWRPSRIDALLSLRLHLAATPHREAQSFLLTPPAENQWPTEWRSPDEPWERERRSCIFRHYDSETNSIYVWED